MAGMRRWLPGVSAARNRLDLALRWRIEEAVAPLRHQIADLRAATDDSRSALIEVRRMAPQLAAAEARLAELTELVTRARPVGDEEGAEAVRLIDEIRKEHRRIRARMTAISWYEERLRRLEERIGGPEEAG